jgi:hypothetical protein
MKMKNKLFLIVFMQLLLALCSCDGYHKTRYTIALDSATVHDYIKIKSIDYQVVFDIIERVAEKYGLKCHPYNEIEEYHGCGIGGLNIISQIKKNTKTVSIKLIEYGPWKETDKYLALKKDLADALEHRFPGQNMKSHTNN